MNSGLCTANIFTNRLAIGSKNVGGIYRLAAVSAVCIYSIALKLSSMVDGSIKEALINSVFWRGWRAKCPTGEPFKPVFLSI